MDLQTWAVPQLRKLMPLDDETLKEVITYTDTLSKEAAATHLENFLGNSSQAIEFISSFNARRQRAPADAKPAASSQPSSRIIEGRADDHEGVPRSRPKQKKPAQKFNKLPPPRQPDNYGDTSGAFKRDDAEYIAAAPRQKKEAPLSNALALQSQPDAAQAPTPTSQSLRLPPGAQGPLISDVRSKASSKPSSTSTSRHASPAPKAKVSVTGGTAMHGQSKVLDDLDSAIRALEIQTNPSLVPSEAENKKRACKCMATRHPLLDAAPNCLNCGKIICVKEGLGPCTFCNTSLLSPDDIQNMVRVLKEERGQAKMDANNAAHRKADVSKAPRPFSSNSLNPSPSISPALGPSPSGSDDEMLSKAKQHRDKLLNFQNQNARRTRVHDEASDFDTPSSGTSMWASPQERALQLKKQQKALREAEWNARPEYEKRQVVASIDLVGGKIVKRMAKAERPRTPESEDEAAGEEDTEVHVGGHDGAGKGGAFSKNPLLGKLIRPLAREGAEGNGKGKERVRDKTTTWRRVQDDNDDNEAWILDGGAYGGRTEGRVLGAEEHAEGP